MEKTHIMALNMKNWIILLCSLLFFQCDYRNDLYNLLTKEDITYWDYYKYSDISGDKRIQSLSFSKNGECKVYSVTVDGKRNNYELSDYSKLIGECDKWRIINDSVINIRCKWDYKFTIINDSTIYLKNNHTKEVKKLYKSKENIIVLSNTRMN
ncbi:Uncharacterised protein [Weeksella virosa]|nr:Uncharacterised protein [Weeksella virosa]